jgi:hypothetical protein
MKERKAASWASRESREEGQEESRGTTRVSPGSQARKGRGLGPKKKEREGKLVGGKEGKGWGWRVVRFGIGSCGGGWGGNSWAEDEGVRRKEMGIGKE